MTSIAAIHDLSGVGRCSLVAAISVLSAMGHCCHPVPTAVLSQQTAFPGYSYLDFTPYLDCYLEGWSGIGLQPDLIFTGFLGGVKQPPLIRAYIERHPGAVTVIDPVMGDFGALYPCYPAAYIDCMRELAKTAHILTPNPTEFALLTSASPVDPLPRSEEALLEMAASLEADRLRQVVITGNCGAGGMENTILHLVESRVEHIPCVHTGVSYSGSGDLFASILCGGVAAGLDFSKTVKMAGDFLSAVAHATDPDADPRLGMAYETHLKMLIDWMKEETIDAQ